MSHYEALNIAKDSDQEAIKRAYHRAARIHHPDRKQDFSDASNVNAKFERIQEAWECLRDAEKRRLYDNTLRLLKSKKEARRASAFRLERSDCDVVEENEEEGGLSNDEPLRVLTYTCRCGEEIEVAWISPLTGKTMLFDNEDDDNNNNDEDDRKDDQRQDPSHDDDSSLLLNCPGCSLVYDVSALLKI